MLTLNDGRSELWQWDTGRTLAVDADCSQVHFSNKVFGRSIDVDVTDGVAIVPDVLLQTDKDLNVWAFVGTAENGYTKISKTFKVNRRNKPADYVFTPVEQTTIAEIAAIAQSVRDDANSGLFDGKPGEDGRDGVDGKDGTPGTDGRDGKDGVSPTVTVSDIQGGHKITITDANGGKTVDVMDGVDGKDGTDGRDGADGYTPVYGTDYGTAEQISEIAQQSAEILKPEVEHLKDDLSDNAKSDAETKRRLDALWKLNQGISYDFVVDSEEAYEKVAPSGGKYAAVEMIGGHTEAIDGALVSAVTDSIVEKGKNLIQFPSDNITDGITKQGITFTVGDGYYEFNGTAKDNLYLWLHKIGTDAPFDSSAYYSLSGAPEGCSKDTFRLSATNGLGVWKYDTGSGTTFQFAELKTGSARVEIDIAKGTTLNHVVFRPQLEKASAPTAYAKYHENTYPIPDAVKNLPGYGWSAGDAHNSIELTDTGWQYVQRVGSRAYQDGDTVTDGVTTYYALDTPVITDITELMADFQENFAVEAGGTITFDNAAKLTVPNSVEYVVKLSEVNQ